MFVLLYSIPYNHDLWRLFQHPRCPYFLTALGELGDRKAVMPLIDVVQEKGEDLWLRVSAISALGNIGDERAAEPIQDALKGDSTGYIKNAAETALARLKLSKQK